jgi:pSer/pThr/pTyr-binding forkhead associated (FHA) protein
MIIPCVKCGAKLIIPDKAKGSAANPTVICPKCKASFRLNDPKPSPPEEVGWLVVHDEKTPPQTLPLRLGPQVVGRRSTSRPCDLMIQTGDPYMGRNHFIIEVICNKKGELDYLLSDAGSMNHTFINRKSLYEVRKGDEYYLQDGDIIQAGETKIIFKSSASVRSSEEASDSVLTIPVGRTVILGGKEQ